MKILFFRNDLVGVIKQHLQSPVFQKDISPIFQTPIFLTFLKENGIISEDIKEVPNKDNSILNAIKNHIKNDDLDS